MRRDLIERLMCNLTVDLAEVATAHGFVPEVFADDLERLTPVIGDGIARVEGTRIVVPTEMAALVRLAAAAFDAYLDRGVARHSRAI